MGNILAVKFGEKALVGICFREVIGMESPFLKGGGGGWTNNPDLDVV